MLVSVDEEMHLQAQAKKHPILPCEIGKKRLAIANVAHVSD